MEMEFRFTALLEIVNWIRQQLGLPAWW